MTKKTSNKGFIGGLAVATLLPLSFWLVTKMLAKDHINMPHYYVADKVNGTDTTFHQVGDIHLVNQLGDTISLNKDLKGKIVVVDFMFTTCKSFCPSLTRNMLLLQRAFRKNDTMVQLLSITVDPAHDSFQVLRTYADNYRVDHDHWWFLTGDRNAIYNLAKNELRLTMQPASGGTDDLIHSQKLVLLDKQRYIRGYYDGLDSADLKRCSDDIVLLSLEKKRKKK